MIFSRACEYSIRAAIFITIQSLEGKRVNLKEISKEIDSPEAFTAKMLQQLKKNKIINSVQGTTGGFEITKENMKNIKLIHIVSAIDGEESIELCIMGLKKCSEMHPCPLHHTFKTIKHDLIDMIQNTSLYSMAMKMKAGKTYLRILN